MHVPAVAHTCVAIVAYPGVGLLDIAGAQNVFWAASNAMAAGGDAGYRCVVVSLEGGLIRTAEGLSINTLAISAVEAVQESGYAIDTLIVPGTPDIMQALAENILMIEWLATHAQRTRRVASVCSGTFFMAAAGLLDGKRVVTHWRMSGMFESRYPQLDIDTEAVYRRQGRVWTSGGVSSGVDLALAMVEADCGRDIAATVAREMVMCIRRPGGQAQLSELLATQGKGCGEFDKLHLWLASNVGRNDLSVELLARQVHMSTRNFSRVYKRSTGLTPAKTIELFRVGAARRMLEDSARNIDQVADACGFGDEERMRVTFHRHLGLSPREYRSRCQAGIG